VVVLRLSNGRMKLAGQMIDVHELRVLLGSKVAKVRMKMIGYDVEFDILLDLMDE